MLTEPSLNQIFSIKLGRDAVKLHLAIGDFTKSLDYEKGNLEALFNRGSANSSLGKYKEALKDLEIYSYLMPKSEKGFTGVGVVYFKLERFSDAAVNFEKALQIDGENTSALFGLGNSLVFMKNKHDAIKYYDKLLSIDRGHKQAAHNLALVCKELFLRKPPAACSRAKGNH